MDSKKLRHSIDNPLDLTQKVCEDILIDILCRCHVKDLCRSKCVCKSWNHLIDQFCIPTIGPPSTVLGIYLCNEYRQNRRFKRVYEYKSLRALNDATDQPDDDVMYDKLCSGRYRLLDCCNGLLLLLEKTLRQYFVYSPTFGQWVEIPKCAHKTHDPSKSMSTSLAYDPSKSPHYKIVRFEKVMPMPLALVLDIYSSETRQWVRMVMDEVDVLDLNLLGSSWSVVYNTPADLLSSSYLVAAATKMQLLSTAVYLKGVVYKLLYNGHIICVDLNRGVKVSIKSLPMRENSQVIGCLGLLMGHLTYAEHMPCSSSEKISDKLYIWLLDDKDNGNKWVLVYNLCSYEIWIRARDHLNIPLGCWFPFLEPYAFAPNSDVIFLGNNHMIVSYHLKTGRIQEVFRTSRDDLTCHSPYIVITRAMVALINQ